MLGGDGWGGAKEISHGLGGPLEIAHGDPSGWQHDFQLFGRASVVVGHHGGAQGQGLDDRASKGFGLQGEVQGDVAERQDFFQIRMSWSKEDQGVFGDAQLINKLGATRWAYLSFPTWALQRRANEVFNPFKQCANILTPSICPLESGDAGSRDGDESLVVEFLGGPQTKSVRLNRGDAETLGWS